MQDYGASGSKSNPHIDILTHIFIYEIISPFQENKQCKEISVQLSIRGVVKAFKESLYLHLKQQHHILHCFSLIKNWFCKNKRLPCKKENPIGLWRQILERVL